jgi:hypothetical protein
MRRSSGERVLVIAVMQFEEDTHWILPTCYLEMSPRGLRFEAIERQ